MIFGRGTSPQVCVDKARCEEIGLINAYWTDASEAHFTRFPPAGQPISLTVEDGLCAVP